MERTRFIVAAWLLLLVPTLLIGGLALQLLGREQGRIADAAAAAAADRARAIAERLDLAVAEVRQGLLDHLVALPADRLADRLEEWRAGSPLVRNVFIWSPTRGLLLPEPGQVSGEEAEFTVRFAELFQGRTPWQGPQSEEGGSTGVGEAAAAPGLRELRKLALRDSGSSAAPAAAPAARPTGWQPWFWGQRLHVLGWADLPGTGLRYGLEVELLALLARLLPGFPAPDRAGETFVLVDGNGDPFHQTGAAPEPGQQPAAAVPVGRELPHWQVAVYLPHTGGLAGATSGGFRLVTSLLVGAFVAAILLGGGLLLQQARRNLLDARSKTSFVSNVSHELKTPLTTIRMYAEMLQEGRVADPGKRAHYLEVIAAESRRLTRIVNNVLDFGRLEQGRKRYRREPVLVGALLRELLETLGPRFRQAGVALGIETPEEDPQVEADRDALEQIVLNLVDNALKYAAAGGEITLAVTPQAERCRVQVLDRGPGVPTQHRQRVFDTFHRVDDSLTAQQPGSGLGLSIARQMARDLGGDLTYRDRPGGGACFELTLPRPTGESA